MLGTLRSCELWALHASMPAQGAWLHHGCIVSLSAELLRASLEQASDRGCWAVLFQLEALGADHHLHHFEKPWFTTWESAVACWVRPCALLGSTWPGAGKRAADAHTLVITTHTTAHDGVGARGSGSLCMLDARQLRAPLRGLSLA